MDAATATRHLHDDVVEEIVSHLSPLDLAPAAQVSKSWRRSVASSLRRNARRRAPWLVLHLKAQTHAFDPISHQWIKLSLPPHPHPVRSSYPGLLYAVSSSMSFSSDPFASSWAQVPPPRLSRRDPVVALVGSRLVVAGGVCDFEGDSRGVEVCDGAGRWEAAEPMPDALKDSAAATWVSVAASGDRMYVLEKRSGLLCAFDPETKRWGRAARLRLGPDVFVSAVGFSGERLILAAAAGEAGDVKSVVMWEVDAEGMELVRVVGEMPPEMVGRMAGDGWGLSSSIGFAVSGRFCYVYNPSDPGEMFICEMGEAGAGRWASIGCPDQVVHNPTRSVVFGCAVVGLNELKPLLRPAAT